MTTNVLKETYGANNPGEDNDKNGGTSLDRFKNEVTEVNKHI